ncbi:hypothetical protein TrLO_g7737 [Triparma laevis f. longispina]|uniref:START domain-containing protein n=1 Tax=Triparma laevis f. longispina TaxID=1714387 RepID=A0A9W7B003_9STRA|nr:hypothetical protein TrLO_g7737 [Triparma laevis f. longispina]
MAEETNDGRDGDEIDADELSSETLSPLPTTPPTPPTTTNHVTECATTYSVLMACITTGYAAIYAYFASSSNSHGLEKLHDFWIWIMLPISVSAMGISFALKPRREDRPYKVFLYAQYFILTYFAEFLGLFWTPPNTSIIVEKSIECLVVYPALFMLGMKSRSRIAKLTDKDLSRFLTNDVVMGGVIIGLGQLTFLMFASIQCDNGNFIDGVDDWRQCNRTLYSSAGLGGMVTLYVLIKIHVSGVVPQHILEKHTISMKKILAMKMNDTESVQAFGLATAVGCALYSLGGYGADGDFRSDAEEQLAFTMPSIGAGCLLLTAAAEMVAIRREKKRQEEDSDSEQLRQGESSSSFSETVLVEASSFWFYSAVLATTFSSVICVAGAATMDERYNMLITIALPIVVLVYGGSLTCQPRRSEKDLWKLRLHFASFIYISQIANAVGEFRKSNLIKAGFHFAGAAAMTVLFHFGLQLRAAIGRLPDKDLERFLIDVVLKGGLETLFSILFLLFRTTKCAFEEGGLEKCHDTSRCAMFISGYLLSWHATKLVQGGVRSEWRKELNLSIEKIAKMRDISLRRGVQGFLTLVTTVCAIFLFSMMSAERMDWTTIEVVGLLGLVSSFGVVISEIYSSLQAQTRRAEEDIEIVRGREEDQEKRARVAGKMRGAMGEPLVEDQVPIFQACEELLGESSGWKALKSRKGAGVEMSMKYFLPEKGERNIGTGKAVGVVDCAAKEVAAWAMDFCSNEKMRISKEEGNPARFELVEKARENERTFASVRAMPFPLHSREFIFRMIWKSEEGKVFVAFESVEEDVDYRAKLNSVRGFTRGMWVIEDLPTSPTSRQCRVTFVLQLAAAGFVPTWAVDRLIPMALSAVQEAIDEFRQVSQEESVNGGLGTEIEEEPVEECSWLFVGVSMIMLNRGREEHAQREGGGHGDLELSEIRTQRTFTTSEVEDGTFALAVV